MKAASGQAEGWTGRPLVLQSVIRSCSHCWKHGLRSTSLCAGYATPGGQSDAAASSLAGPQGSPPSQPASPASTRDDLPGRFTPADDPSSPRKTASGSMQPIVRTLQACSSHCLLTAVWHPSQCLIGQEAYQCKVMPHVAMGRPCQASCIPLPPRQDHARIQAIYCTHTASLLFSLPSGMLDRVAISQWAKDEHYFASQAVSVTPLQPADGPLQDSFRRHATHCAKPTAQHGLHEERDL